MHLTRREKITSVIVVGFTIAFLLRVFVVEGFIVRGDSMAPTLEPGDYVFIFKQAYLFGEPRDGDVIIARPRELNVKLVKRIAGVPGEEVVEGEKGVRRLDPNEYFLLGDNAEVSIDSRNLGFVDRWSIKGKAFGAINFRHLKYKSLLNYIK